MTDHEPERIDDDLRAPDEVSGTDDGDPTAGVEASEDDVADAVQPDDDALEVDGPTQKHA